jgi:hypothetical protein
MSSGGGKDAGSTDAAIAKAGGGKVEIKKIEESKNTAQTSAGKARALMALAPTSAPVTGGTEPTGRIQVKGPHPFSPRKKTPANPNQEPQQTQHQ